MGCGSSSGIKEEPLDAAQAVQPGAGGNKGSGSGGGKTLPPLSAASNGPDAAAAVDPAAVSALLAAHRWAESVLAPEPASVAAASSLELNGGGDSPSGAGNVDAIAGSYVVADDLGIVVAHLSSSDACTLFSESKAGALEITPQSLAELLLLAGGTDELLRSLKRLDAQGIKCASMAELGPALAHLQCEDAAALASAAGEALPADVVTALLAAREVLANPACELYPYALVPRITATPAVGAAGEHDEELELDFSHVNQLMVQTRTRLTFLAPRFLVQLVHACGRGGPSGRLVVLDVLNGLALQERSFEAPSALLRAALLHRAAALEAQGALQTKMAAADASAKVVPEALQQQVGPMVSSLAAVEPSCVLQPLLAPLIPTLSNLTPTLRHLQAYLARFLPLLQESAAAAMAAGTAPGDDAATAQIVSAYLIPFLKLTQPWIIQLRPYLAGLQPFFEALQPNLVLTHAAFGTLQPFLASLAPHLGVSAGSAGAADSAADDSVAAVSVDKVSPFLLSTPSFVTALERVVTVLAVLHPLLRQLHPLCEGLLSFCAELGVFLAQLQSLLDLLAQYQTLPLEPDTAPKEDEGEDDQELSSIARPWFPDEEGEQAADATATAQLSAPQFLAKHGRFLGKLSPYVTQLRPFAADIDAFVQKFAPFLAQLAPFYKEQLKHVVKPMLLLLLPTSASAGASASSGTAAAPEIDEATLQRLLSS